MIHQGPIPWPAHQIGDYVSAVLLIAAPFLLGFDSGTATAIGIVLGVCVLVVAASTDGPLSFVNAIPIPLHIFLDVAVGAMLIASPFLFGFSDDGTALAFFLILGVLEILGVIATKFPGERRERVAKADAR